MLLQVGDSVMNQVTKVKGLELTAGPWVYDSHVEKSVKEKSGSRHHKELMKDMTRPQFLSVKIYLLICSPL